MGYYCNLGRCAEKLYFVRGDTVHASVVTICSYIGRLGDSESSLPDHLMNSVPSVPNYPCKYTNTLS